MNYVFGIPIASLVKIAEVRCPRLCAETLFVLFLKFGAVLSIICGLYLDPFTAVEVDKTP